MSDAEQKVRGARAKLVQLRPYFDSAIYALVPVKSERCPSLAVDRHKRLYFSPRFVERLSVDELVTCLIHELGHVLRDHGRRANAVGVTDRTYRLANIAMDMELNDDIRAEVVELKDLPHLPRGVYYPERINAPEGDVWESYYHAMLGMERVEEKLLGKSSGNGANGDEQAQEGSGGKSERGDGFAHDCGSGAHGMPRPWEAGVPVDEGGTSQVEGVTDADWQDIVNITAEKIVDHAKKNRGTLAGGWLSWARNIVRPRPVPWDTVLAASTRRTIATASGMMLHTYARPSRRSAAYGDFIMPHMRRPKPHVVIVGDTSMSMDAFSLSLIRGVVEDVCTSLGAQVTFLSVDTAVHSEKKVARGTDIELIGRGGTDMRVGIDRALELRPPADSIIVVTDCGTQWPEAPLRRAKLIVCATDALSGDLARVPSWAKLIRVDPDNTSSRYSGKRK